MAGRIKDKIIISYDINVARPDVDLSLADSIATSKRQEKELNAAIAQFNGAIGMRVGGLELTQAVFKPVRADLLRRDYNGESEANIEIILETSIVGDRMATIPVTPANVDKLIQGIRDAGQAAISERSQYAELGTLSPQELQDVNAQVELAARRSLKDSLKR